MQKKFFSSVVLIVLLNLIIKPFYLFGVDAQIQNTVGAEDYGLYFSLLNFSFLFNILLDAGITNYNTKTIAESPRTISRYLSTILGVKITLGFIYAFITLGAALLLDYSNYQMSILGILVINQFLVSLLLYLRSNFSGLHLFKTDAIMSVLDRLILIIICLFLLYGAAINQPFKIEWFVYAQTFSYGFAAITALLISLKYVKRPRLKMNRLFSIAILRKSSPYALLILLMMLYSRVDAVMLERLLENGKVEAGIYAQGFRLLDAANIFALLIAGLLLPMFARLIKQKEQINDLIQFSGQLLIGVAILVGISCSLFAEPLMQLIYIENTSAAATAFPWIILSFIPMAATYIFGTLLTANGSLKQLNRMAISGFGVNIALNFLLIPEFGAEGAAIATLLTQSFTALWQVVLVLYIFKLKMHKTSTLRLIGFTLLMVGTGYLILQIKTNLAPIYLFLTHLIIGISLLFIFRLIHWRALAELVYKRS